MDPLLLTETNDIQDVQLYVQCKYKEDNPMTTVTFRTDEKTKKEAAALFEKLGTNLSAAINAFLRTSVELGRLPYEIDYEPKGQVQGCPPEILALFSACADLPLLDADEKPLPVEDVDL